MLSIVARPALAAGVCAAFLFLSGPALAQTPASSPLLFDKDMTVGAGATVATTAGDALARLEEAVVPHRILSERGLGRRVVNVAYRFAKLTYFDLPQEQWLAVANHEVFGHGGRLRELFDGPIGYRVDAPTPYGDGGGSTRFSFDREPTVPELLAISTGGMEANAVSAAILAGRAVEGQRLRARDAMRYLMFELDPVSYVLGTDAEEEPGHDVFEFMRTYNTVADASGNDRLEAGTLRRDALAGLANPMLAYSLIGIGRYLWNGTTDSPVPTIRIGPVRYLPSARYRLTPVGRDIAIVNDLVAGSRWTQLEVSVGRWQDARPWAVSLRQRSVAAWSAWSLSASGDLWRQPSIAPDAAPAGPLQWGGAVRARVERPLTPVWFGGSLSLIVEGGAKSSGFVPGEPLRSGLVGRVGVGLPLVR